MTAQPDVLIIGGGAIGVCAAYDLAGPGCRVTLVEQGGLAAGSSYGNPGLIVPSHIIPLSAPGALTSGLKWLLDPESPFYIKPQADLKFAWWLLQFAAHCTHAHLRRAVPVLHALGRASIALYEQWAALPGLDCGYQRLGLLTLFNSQQGLQAAMPEVRLLQANGIEAQVLDGAQVREMEPNVLPGIVGGTFYPGDAHFTPDQFVRALAGLAEQKGARFRTGVEVLGFERTGRRVTTVRTTRGDFTPDEIVLAAGAWSPTLAHDLQLNLPIQPAKGYSITVKRPATAPRIPLALGESRVVVTPMNGPDGPVLRFAGTLELAGFDFSVNRRRVNAVARAARSYLPGMDDLETVEIWRGLRPCTPDGLPIIARPQSLENVVVATGHAMLGMSLAPITGKLVGQLVRHEPPALDLTPLRVERFL